MSIQHLAAVLYHMPELTERGAAFALAAIADSADRETGFTHWKTLGAIARAARLTTRGARMCLRSLELGGYVRTELRGDAGRQGMRWRVLFDMHGARKPELELYSQPPERRSGVKKRPPEASSGPPEASSGPPEASSGPPEASSALYETVPIRPYPSLSKERLKNARGKKIPPAATPPDLEPERRRQADELRRRMSASP